MAENSKIGWTDHTMNFWWGCNKVREEPLLDDKVVQEFPKRRFP